MVTLFITKCYMDDDNKERNANEDIVVKTSKVFTKIIIDNLRCTRYMSDICLQKQLMFYNENIPRMSIKEYCERIVMLTHCEEGSFIASVLYVDRLCKYNNVILTLNNIHKMLFTSIIISIKYNEDQCYMDDYYAKVGGVTLLEYTQLQYEFLQLIKYNLYISEKEYETYKQCFGGAHYYCYTQPIHNNNNNNQLNCYMLI